MIQSIKIYKINQENHKLKKLPSRKDRIDEIIKEAFAKYKNKFNIDSIPSYEIDGLTYYLFVYNFPEKISDWSEFLPYQLTNTVKLNTLSITLLLFIDNGIDVFVVVGGKGFEVIVPFIDHTFGLSLLSNIITPEEDVIVSINSRGLTGVRSGISEQYRNDFRLIDFVRFGKVPTEVHLLLSNKISDEHFNFLQNKPNERIRIYSGKSFKIKKNLNFTELHKLLLEIGFMLEKEPNNYLSTYIEIKDEDNINNNLRPLLIRALFDDREFVLNPNTTDKRFKFDLCDPNKMREFYEADYYILKEREVDEGNNKQYREFSRVESKDEIYNSVMRRAIESIKYIDYFKFRTFIQGVRVVSYSDGKKVAGTNFVFLFTAEFPFEGKSVFLVDTKWYILNQSFIEDLQFECVQTIKNHKLPDKIFDIPWDKSTLPTEGKYNLEYEKRDNYIVLDTYTPDGVELCDVLYIENGKIYLIHVKFGFDSPLRELSNQITLSAKRLYEDTKSGKFNYLDKVFERAIGKSKNLQKYNKEEFIQLFKKTKIVYVFAFASQLHHDKLVEDNIEEYKSNIARYSLVQCSKEMQTSFGFELNIWQIRRK